MRTTLVCCLLLNLAVILASGALLQWFPSQQGFTVTTPHATHSISGGNGGRPDLRDFLLFSMEINHAGLTNARESVHCTWTVYR
jgi:hypothetical protein